MSKDKYIVYFVSRTKERMSQFIQAQLKTQQLDDIIPTHGNILTALYAQGTPMPLSEIARRIGRDKSTVTPLVNKLERLGYVERVACKKDKRVTYVHLTQKGLALKPRFDLISRQVYETAYQGFTPEEKEQFLKLLKKLYQNFKHSPINEVQTISHSQKSSSEFSLPDAET